MAHTRTHNGWDDASGGTAMVERLEWRELAPPGFEMLRNFKQSYIIWRLFATFGPDGMLTNCVPTIA